MFLYKVFFWILYQYRTAEGCCSWLHRRINRSTLFVGVNKVQVKGEEKKVESKKVCNFPYTCFHNNGLIRFFLLDLFLVFGH